MPYGKAKITKHKLECGGIATMMQTVPAPSAHAAGDGSLDPLGSANESALRPCPFCGAVPYMEEYTYTGDVTYRRIYCENDDCYIKPETSRCEGSKAEILNWWNRRANKGNSPNEKITD